MAWPEIRRSALFGCHSRRESAAVVAFAFLAVIPEGNLLCPCLCFSGCHSRRESAFVVAFLVVIPVGNLLLSLPFWLSFPQGICCCPCLCFSGCHSRRESAFVVAFLVVIPVGNLLFPLSARARIAIAAGSKSWSETFADRPRPSAAVEESAAGRDKRRRRS